MHCRARSGPLIAPSGPDRARAPIALRSGPNCALCLHRRAAVGLRLCRQAPIAPGPYRAHSDPIRPRLHRQAARLHSGPLSVAPSGPLGPLNCTMTPRPGSGPNRAPIASSGPDRAPLAPSGPDQPCFIKLQGGILSNTGGEGVPRGFWEGAVLLGVSPELIFFLIFEAKYIVPPRWTGSNGTSWLMPRRGATGWITTISRHSSPDKPEGVSDDLRMIHHFTFTRLLPTLTSRTESIALSLFSTRHGPGDSPLPRPVVEIFCVVAVGGRMPILCARILRMTLPRSNMTGIGVVFNWRKAHLR